MPKRKQNLDLYEENTEFFLKIVDADEVIKTNLNYKSNNLFNEIMVKRETMVLQMIKDEIIKKIL